MNSYLKIAIVVIAFVVGFFHGRKIRAARYEAAKCDAHGREPTWVIPTSMWHKIMFNNK